MKVCGGVVFGLPRAAAFPTLIFRHCRPTLRCYSSYFPDHVSFIKDVAATQPPDNLNLLLKFLQVRGEQIISPGAKQGLIPLAIPLSKNNSGSVTALLRWPTAPFGMEMPVVEVLKYGVWLLSKTVDQYIHRLLVEEDAESSSARKEALFYASADAGIKIYEKGHFAASQIANMDTYLLKNVGLFPDVLEHKIKHHLDKRDTVSALVTAEFYIKKEHFPGFELDKIRKLKILQGWL